MSSRVSAAGLGTGTGTGTGTGNGNGNGNEDEPKNEHKNIQYGENNHIEYKWSNIQQENILQLSYQLVRTSNIENKTNVGIKFKQCFQAGTVDEKRLLLKMLAHTRDIEYGKGEYALSLIMLKELMSIDRKLSIEMMKRFVGYVDDPVDEMYNYIGHRPVQSPYGSWKDMKYYFNEISNCPKELITIINNQVKRDVINMNNGLSCSLISKWIPRETNNKFGWINVFLAMNYYYLYGSSEWSGSATRKAQTHYRQLISSLNKYIDTTQIKQCGHQWNKINFNNVTGITLMKQQKAFLNMNTRMNNQPAIKSNDRIQCRDNLLNYIEHVKQGKYKMKYKTTSIISLVKAAINLTGHMDLLSDKHNENRTRDLGPDPDPDPDSSEMFLINEAWRSKMSQIKQLDNVIAMIDTSCSMEQYDCNPLYSAIGLGICVAEKSTIGKRIITFTNKPSWVNLDDCLDFVSCVKKIRDIEWGMNTDFYRAMDLILDTIVTNKISSEEVEKIVLVVFSDMQFDGSGSVQCKYIDQYTEYRTVVQVLEQKYHDAGVQVCGKGYKVPHILFWNLKSTHGFPELSYQDSVTMLSGYSPMLLNTFISDGVAGLQKMTPWLMLNNMLNKDRYNILNELIL